MTIKKLLAGIALAAAFSPLAAHAELITNGNFAAGMTGWSTNANSYFTDANGYHDGTVGYESSLTQAVNGGVGALTLQFDFKSCCTGYQRVEWDGVDISGIMQADSLTHYVFTVTGTGTDTLAFRSRNDPSFNTLDNISLKQANAVPEPASLALLGLGIAAIGFARRKAGKA